MSAQPKIAFKNLLLRVSENPDLSIRDNELEYLSGDPFRVPFVDDVEFRTQTSEWDIVRQQYTVRVSFNGWKERNYYRELQKQMMNTRKLENEMLYHEEIAVAYFSFLDYYYGHRYKEIREKEKKILADKLRVLDILAKKKNELKVKEILSVEDDFYELEMEIVELEAANIRLMESFGITMSNGSDYGIDTTGFISFGKMESSFLRIEENIESHPEIRMRKSQMEETFAEYDLELAKTKKILDFGQVRYAGRNNLGVGNEFSIGFGLRIPIKGSNVVNLRELELEMISDENRVLLEKIELQNDIGSMKSKFTELKRKRDIILEQISRTKSRFEKNNYSNVAINDPLALLDIEESELDRRMEILELEHEMIGIYLTVLNLNGYLSKETVFNYLSEGLDRLN